MLTKGGEKMNENKYIVTMRAKEQIEKYDTNEFEMELLEKQLKLIEEMKITDGFFVNEIKINGELKLTVGTGIVKGKIFQTVTCVPDELLTIRDVMHKSIFGF